jgi:glycolate oxidase iron-sulfur subunit
LNTPLADQLKDAQQCVMCGMCLPHCPTYGELRVEGDSPRGRINLMQGLAQGRFKPEDPRLRDHIDGCLGCRSCEAICPAQVPFGKLMDATRALVRAPAPGKAGSGGALAALTRMARGQAFARPQISALGALGARWAARLRLGSWLPESTLLGRTLRHTAPALNKNRQALTPSQSARQASLTTDAASADALLFTGCMTPFFSSADIAAALQVLEAMGLKVHIPAGQVCCGAMDQHLGYPQAAARLKESNLTAFFGNLPIIALDSGCQAELREYSDGTWRDRAISLPDFLASLPPERWKRAFGDTPADSGKLSGEQQPQPTIHPIRIALHLPCTLRNAVRRGAQRRAFYASLPGVSIVTTHPGTGCCGAGGTAMLTQPAMADALGGATLAALEELQPDLIVSDNVGCRVHLMAIAEQANRGVPILSGARFLASRLPSQD